MALLTRGLLLVLALLTPRDMKETINKASGSLVLILTQEVDGTGFGSGEVVGHRGEGDLILTCAHVVAGASAVLVVEALDGPKGRVTRAHVVAWDQVHDLALVETARSFGGPVLPIAAKEPETFDVVYMLSNPNGIAGLRTAGVGLLSRTKSPHGKIPEMYQITGFAWPGSSGGMVVNTSGQLVGVIKAVMVDDGVVVPEVVYAIRYPYVADFLSKYGGAK